MSDAVQSLNTYELPPLPPAGAFDARFASGRMIELADSQKQREIPISITTSALPISIGWDVTTSLSTAELVVGGKATKLIGKGIISIDNLDQPIHLRLFPGSAVREVPKEFVLEQNYPNPFNPATTLRYQLPVDSRVQFTIYNVLGQVVSTLLNEVEPVGYKSVEWNATNFASGVYFYRLEATSVVDPGKTFTQVKKMVLIK
jgi:hypothetical protein